MIPQVLTDLSTKFAPALGNHIWQSTLFACAIALLTLAFRDNRARVRYWLWLAASLKFLIPFSPLMTIGTRIAWPRPSAAPAPSLDLYAAMQHASEPFAQPEIARTIASPAAANTLHLSPILLAAWLCGVFVVFLIWYLRWRRVRASVREAAPLSDGREWQTLRRLERAGKMSRPIDIFLSHASLEPGIFGIARPVLVWPRGISERLADAHLHAVLAHELWHVRRRDNLAAALHMLVEALFWFNPVVWWIGARLLNERERACDEAVLESGGDPQIYAESIRKICEFCVGSPLPCVSGVTSADLKKRITRIMSEGLACKLDLRRKLLLVAAAVLAIAVPIAAGMFHAAPRVVALHDSAVGSAAGYASVSIAPSKPNGGSAALMFGPDNFASRNAPLQQVIRAAYGVEDDRIIGAPDWLKSEKYDVAAKEDKSADNDPRKLGFDQRVSEQARMLQALLADRLKLSLHRETRDLSIYALVLAKDGPKLHESKPGDTYPGGFKGADGIARPGGIHFDNSVESGDNYSGSGTKLIAQGIPVGALLWHLQAFLHRTIVDETGLSGTYDFTFQVPSLPPIEASGRILSAHLEQQLGLKLEPQNVPMEVLVIDHVERPVPSAGDKLAFRSASVRPNNSINQDTAMNVPMGPEDVHFPTEGLFSGSNVRLIGYIHFAYNLTGNQFQLLMPQLPKWVISDRFDIQAQADGNPNKAEMRLMMRSLLADRFKLAIHYETRQLPLLALILANPGETGPQLRPHRDDSPCSSAPALKNSGTSPAPPKAITGEFPIFCGDIEGMTSGPSGRLRVGARSVPIGLLADTLAQMGNLNRAVVDQTGLSGTFDFTFEWTPQLNGPGTPQLNDPSPPQSNTRNYNSGPTFLEDLQHQLGLKLVSQTGPVPLLVIDHVEMPSEN